MRSSKRTQMPEKTHHANPIPMPEKREHTACIDARDITGHVGDALHYNADAQLEIGRRFAKTYLELIKK